MLFNLLILYIIIPWLITIFIFYLLEKDMVIDEKDIEVFKRFGWHQWMPIINTLILVFYFIFVVLTFSIGIVFCFFGWFFKKW